MEITISNLTKKYKGKTALNEASLLIQVKRGKKR